IVTVMCLLEYRQGQLAVATRGLVLTCIGARRPKKGPRLGRSVVVSAGGPDSPGLIGKPERFEPLCSKTRPRQHEQRQCLSIIILGFSKKISCPGKGLHRLQGITRPEKGLPTGLLRLGLRPTIGQSLA